MRNIEKLEYVMLYGTNKLGIFAMLIHPPLIASLYHLPFTEYLISNASHTESQQTFSLEFHAKSTPVPKKCHGTLLQLVSIVVILTSVVTFVVVALAFVVVFSDSASGR